MCQSHHETGEEGKGRGADRQGVGLRNRFATGKKQSSAEQLTDNEEKISWAKPTRERSLSHDARPEEIPGDATGGGGTRRGQGRRKGDVMGFLRL
jgi:hypothetical protein